MNLQSVLNLNPINSTESAKVKAIADSILADGWVGAPLVVMGDVLITGSHRVEALSLIQSDVSGMDVPVIGLEDLFDEAGLNLAETMEEEGCTEAWDSSFAYVLGELTAEIQEKYGVQY